MTVYKAPLADLAFVLHDLLGVEEALGALPGWRDIDRPTIERILGTAALFAEDELFPLNRAGDREGCTFENGEVRTPTGFKAAFARFAAGGWCGLTAQEKWGGQALPQIVDTAVLEIWGSANLSFSDYGLVIPAAVETIDRHAEDALKERYLPAMVAGKWAATMCMTEPHCGTDLGLLKTRAEPQGDGGYRLTGTKCFISGGEHDLAPNIVHLVLARLPDAPAGVRGISLFLAPKFLPDAKGEPGARNQVRAIGIEHKMGYAASATCTMVFEGAQAWLVGPPHRGLNCLFTMVNAARLAVGMQGLSLAETAYQSAANYARERLQSRAPSGPRFPDRPADPLIVQPDVRRMLLSARAFIEAARALALWTALQLDIAARHPDAATRERASDLAAFLTPAIKAGFSDWGFAACDDAMQIWGGHGYIRANGMEQLVRDVRLARIQEGANAIQALDLFGRKMAQNGGRAFRSLVEEIENFLDGPSRAPGMAEFAVPLAASLARTVELVAWLGEQDDRNELAAAGVDAMRVFVLMLFAWTWARIVHACRGRADALAEGKRAVARHFFARLLPLQPGHAAAAMAGAASLMALADDQV